MDKQRTPKSIKIASTVIVLLSLVVMIASFIKASPPADHAVIWIPRR